MQIDPRHLEQLAAIVEHGTLQEAARRIGTSQPALSRMITNLEGRMGAQLFERSSRPLVATEIGRKLADHGRAIRAARLRAAEDVELGLRGLSGELKIGAPPFLCERLVGDAIAAFLRNRPNIEFELVSDYFPQLERAVLLNQLDVMICPLRLLVSSRSELAVEPLFDDEHVIVCREGHPLVGKDTLTPTDFEAVTWIGHSRKSRLRADMASALASFGISDLQFTFQSESAGAVFEMLRTTDCVTVLPRYAIRRPASESGLAVLPVRIDLAPMSVGMVTPGGRLESPLLQAFTAHMRDYVAGNLDQARRR